MSQEFNAAYWQERYIRKQTGWDVGGITKPLQDYFDQLPNKDQHILIPGCGNGHEAAYLFKAGFHSVFLVDFAAKPLQDFAALYPDFPKEQLIQEDFFKLEGCFDLMVEQTFFCALPPALREAYALKCASLLVPGGKLVGLLFDTIFQQEGPPFGGSREEYKEYFKPFFEFIHFEKAYNSIKPREGRELFICLQKK